MVVLVEIDVEDLKNIKLYIHIVNSRVQLPKGLAEGPTRRIQGLSRHCLGSVSRRAQVTPRQSIDALGL